MVSASTKLWIVRLLALICAAGGIALLKMQQVVGWVLVGVVVIVAFYHTVLMKQAKAERDLLSGN